MSTQTVTKSDESPQDLTLFQQNILLVLAEGGSSEYGLGIKDQLEALYGEQVNHGRLYPNLDQLVERGLVIKGERDNRTNDYRLSRAGKELLIDDVSRRSRIVAPIEHEIEGGDGR